MTGANVFIHATQFPEVVRAQLLACLRSRKINHKFHYDSYKQAQKWLALHEAYSPARNDADCQGIYTESFRAAIRHATKEIHLIGLGCGGGQKEASLLRLLKNERASLSYSPCDVAVALVLTARQAASEFVIDQTCWPVVCDLAEADDLQDLFSRHGEDRGRRIVTFFGMIPNFEADLILPRLRSLLRRDDTLLFSANLAPEVDYVEGVQKILPQYDNELTKDWLLTLLLDLGVERTDGNVVFAIEETKKRYQRVVADFIFSRARGIRVGSERFDFSPGDKVRLFFSYRYQPAHVAGLLKEQGIEVVDQWVTQSQEEGVFLCKLSQGAPA